MNVRRIYHHHGEDADFWSLNKAYLVYGRPMISLQVPVLSCDGLARFMGHGHWSHNSNKEQLGGRKFSAVILSVRIVEKQARLKGDEE